MVRIEEILFFVFPHPDHPNILLFFFLSSSVFSVVKKMFL
jgi:hypothetical protein